LSRTDEFVAWLSDELERGTIDLIAPTSDYISFCAAEALGKLGGDGRDAGQPDPDGLRTCLFKDRFAVAMEHVGFPTPPTATPVTVTEAQASAAEIGYPVVLKPRTHAGIGTYRGTVARTPEDLAVGFRRYAIADGNTCVTRHDPDLALPILQRYHELGTVEVVSVSGCLDRTGEVLALSHSRKVSQSPRRLGVGTMFEPLPAQPFTDAAVEAVRQLLGSGLFELEVLVDRRSGEFWAVDLNPRGFGQMSLDMALGNDLPVLWYNSVTGEHVPAQPARARRPRYWHEALSSYIGFAVRFVQGPHRSAIAGHAKGRMLAPNVGAMFDRRDPMPGVFFGLAHLRHPRALIRPFLVDIEVADIDPAGATGARSHGAAQA
jgi:predicted ATP-grasp superfamily ATP-dependent carboligase